jgi:AcrR family transcriptional regulator
VGQPKRRRYDNASRAAAAQQTRERIMRAAIELFYELTYDEMTFARIAERAGVSPQTVVLHFKTKDNLVAETAKWWRPREEGLRETPTGDPFEAAEKLCARYELTGKAVMHVLAVEESVPGVQSILRHGRRSHREWVEATFGRFLARSGAVRERQIMQLVVAYDIYTWSILRRVMSAEETVTAMGELARAVLDGVTQGVTRGGARR